LQGYLRTNEANGKALAKEVEKVIGIYMHDAEGAVTDMAVKVFQNRAYNLSEAVKGYAGIDKDVVAKAYEEVKAAATARVSVLHENVIELNLDKIEAAQKEAGTTASLPRDDWYELWISNIQCGMAQARKTLQGLHQAYRRCPGVLVCASRMPEGRLFQIVVGEVEPPTKK
jgi:hypothetical protein